MRGFQLVFRQDGHADKSEFRFNNGDGEPRINGELVARVPDPRRRWIGGRSSLVSPPSGVEIPHG